MTPQERRERQLALIREAATRRALQAPPLTERQIERLVFLLDPYVADSNRRRPTTTLRQAA